jgi:hypothetical protein
MPSDVPPQHRLEQIQKAQQIQQQILDEKLQAERKAQQERMDRDRALAAEQRRRISETKQGR